jgi:hypothetical protein
MDVAKHMLHEFDTKLKSALIHCKYFKIYVCVQFLCSHNKHKTGNKNLCSLWNKTTWQCIFLTNTDTQAPNYMAYTTQNHSPAHQENMDRNVELLHISQLHT